MTDPSLGDLEQQRDRLYAELAATGDFRRGSISENYRRCGKPNCACAQPDHPGHGPRYLWTRTVPGRGTRGRQLRPTSWRRYAANWRTTSVSPTVRADRGGQRGHLRGTPARCRRRGSPSADTEAERGSASRSKRSSRPR